MEHHFPERRSSALLPVGIFGGKNTRKHGDNIIIFVKRVVNRSHIKAKQDHIALPGVAALHLEKREVMRYWLNR